MAVVTSAAAALPRLAAARPTAPPAATATAAVSAAVSSGGCFGATSAHRAFRSSSTISTSTRSGSRRAAEATSSAWQRLSSRRGIGDAASEWHRCTLKLTRTARSNCNGSGSGRGRVVHGVGRRGDAVALFTGIVEEMGRVKDLRQVDTGGWEMDVEADVTLQGVQLGDSIAVNGTCLTVTHFDDHSFRFGLAPETLRRTSLGELEKGSPVNLERSLRPDSRMGGHFVQGHVDATGTIVSFSPEGDSLWVRVQAPPELMRYIVPKGYIAVDGTSLTVVQVDDKASVFSFMLVAYTQQKIVVPTKKVGNKVNLEVDIVGKYVERMLTAYTTQDGGPLQALATRLGASSASPSS